MHVCCQWSWFLGCGLWLDSWAAGDLQIARCGHARTALDMDSAGETGRGRFYGSMLSSLVPVAYGRVLSDVEGTGS